MERKRRKERLQRAEETQRLKQEETRFFKAIKEGEKDTVEVLLKDEAFMLHLQETDKLSLAFVQVVLLNNVELLRILLNHGIDVQATDSMFEENGIMHAVRYGHKEMLECLLSCGIGINHQSENGSTALHVAVENGKHECLKILVKQKGVDLNIKDCSGYSPLLWTARLRDWRAMEIMINAGCNIESKDFCKGINCLHITVDKERAFWKGKHAGPEDTTNCIDQCVNAGININQGDIYGNSPLIYAVKSNNLPAVKRLLKLNCNIESCSQASNAGMPFYFHKNLAGSESSLFPLYIAISRLQTSSVKMLCAAGAQYHLLAREPNILSFLDTASPQLKSMLDDMIFNPMSLKQACRIVVRQSIKGNILKTAAELELPASLVRYICLDDIDSM
ncbi:ankycorbin-like isoform X2 [Mercenaria mercenaria]|nr:ankycorbin-like isoform X2 [Mercenaria mercenaria]